MKPVLGFGYILAAAAGSSSIKDDERVVFFPTYAKLAEGGKVWETELHGWIFEPEESSISRAALLKLMQEAAGFDPEDADGPLFRQRAGLFFSDNERGKKVTIRLGKGEHPAGESAANGHFRAALRIPREDAARLGGLPGAHPRHLTFHAVTRGEDARLFAGEVHLIEEAGLSVVSDIDDTIKKSDVRNRRALLENTFLKEFREVPGMAERYAAWAKEGACFHYVSASPWQLYPHLADFIRSKGFPAGTFHMKDVRLKDRTALQLFDPPAELKRSHIEEVLGSFPGRRFVLVGDSGEADPEIYGALALEHAEQVARVFIRDVTDEDPGSARYRKAFGGLPAEKWLIFDDPADLPALQSIARP